MTPETIDAQLDSIIDKYAPGTPERNTLLDLNGLFVRLVKASQPTQDNLAAQIKEHIAAHRGNPALHADLSKTARLFCSAIREALNVAAGEGEGDSPTSKEASTNA